MSAIVFDIETNGLYEEADTIWCITTKDRESQRLESVDVRSTKSRFSSVLDDADEYIGHNIINYDFPVLRKIEDWEPNPNAKITDTLVLSRLLNPDRRKPTNLTGKSGPHSLEAWGCRVGKAKPAHETWHVFDTAMLRRNREDVEINNLVYNQLQLELIGHNWSEAIELEHDVARIITNQEIRGVAFDSAGAVQLISKLDSLIKSIDDFINPQLPYRYSQHGASVSRPFLKNGDYSKMVRDWEYSSSELDSRIVGGPFTRLAAKRIDIGSVSQLKEYFLSIGWVPTEWNYDKETGEPTSPKLTEDISKTVGTEVGRAISDRRIYSHRRSQIQGWLNRVRGDGRLSAGANTCGTNTGRFRHHTVVNVPANDPDVIFGKEMRSLFIASPGRKFIGHDASGLELRMLAHYMGDEDYIQEILHGDIHTYNQKLAGLETRKQAKTFIYAFIYGAGDAKLGSIIGGTASDGAALRRRFLKALPALDRLIKRVKQASKKGWLKGLDGRKVWMRRYSDGRIMERKALNTLLQSAGAIVMKKSMCILDQDVRTSDLDVWKVIDMHDEAQADVAANDAEYYAELAVNSIVKAGEYFNLKIPLAAEAKIGMNWAETH